MQTIEQLAAHLHKGNPEWVPPETLLWLDPGETTGWTLFKGFAMRDYGQLATQNMDYAPKVLEDHLDHLLAKYGKITDIGVEDYRIYAWKANMHTWAALHTPRFIGCVETLASQRKLHVHKQSAQVAKNFCTDAKLQAWNVYVTKKHARDAIRHAVYYIIFNHNKTVK